MIRYYKTIDSKLEKINEPEEGCWINLVEPNQSEIHEIHDYTDIDIESINAALDEEERSRIEVNDNHTLILIDIPIDESDSNNSLYSTIPLGIIITEEIILTVCSEQTKILNDFIVGHIKDFYTHMKSRFLLQILHKNASYYLHYLRRINKMTTTLEKEIYDSMQNKQLIQLLELEKSLVYFSTSLKSNELVLNKMLKTSSIKKYHDDDDLLDDVIVENRQALEMATIYGDILSRIMDAFSAIISNNQNNVMQVLTVITLIVSLPTLISGFFGMNVGGIPLAENPNGFWLISFISVIICIIITMLMSKNKLL
ncbi:MAG: magnesium transporter CorA family protein [Peptacetobacter hiranonis]|uniref:magnesium transporter CorA family protein n=1 Tax=Peptacetobacter hiranonis TaxID=89152 RepID=UPI0022DFCF35|nr:magnesium transporter CorA family protein [Peptacetobacter hiranonis]MED9948187.1 magnesium transporter CorA family protein [Peptacetobacter hiranonis]